MKKQRFIKITAFILSIVALSTSAACGGNDSQGGGIIYEKPAATLPESIALSGTNIIEGGKSDYKIVVPENADALISFAASEMQNFIKDFE